MTTQTRRVRIRQGNQWVEQEVKIKPCAPNMAKFANRPKPEPVREQLASDASLDDTEIEGE